MADGDLLALALLARRPVVAITRFEDVMFVRVAGPAQESATNMALCLSKDGAHKMAAIMRGHAAAGGQKPDVSVS